MFGPEYVDPISLCPCETGFCENLCSLRSCTATFILRACSSASTEVGGTRLINASQHLGEFLHLCLEFFDLRGLFCICTLESASCLAYSLVFRILFGVASEFTVEAPTVSPSPVSADAPLIRLPTSTPHSSGLYPSSLSRPLRTLSDISTNVNACVLCPFSCLRRNG